MVLLTTPTAQRIGGASSTAKVIDNSNVNSQLSYKQAEQQAKDKAIKDYISQKQSEGYTLNNDGTLTKTSKVKIGKRNGRQLYDITTNTININKETGTIETTTSNVNTKTGITSTGGTQKVVNRLNDTQKLLNQINEGKVKGTEAQKRLLRNEIKYLEAQLKGDKSVSLETGENITTTTDEVFINGKGFSVAPSEQEKFIQKQTKLIQVEQTTTPLKKTIVSNFYAPTRTPTTQETTTTKLNIDVNNIPTTKFGGEIQARTRKDYIIEPTIQGTLEARQSQATIKNTFDNKIELGIIAIGTGGLSGVKNVYTGGKQLFTDIGTGNVKGVVEDINPLNILQAGAETSGAIFTAIAQPTPFTTSTALFKTSELATEFKVTSEVVSKSVKGTGTIIEGSKGFKKQDVILSTADVLGEKGLTKIESKPIFNAPLENVNLIKTEYGIIEVEQKPIITRQDKVKVETKKPTSTKDKNIFDEQQEIYAKQGTGASTKVDFNKLDLTEDTQSMKGTSQSLVGSGQSLQGQSGASLQTLYQEPSVIVLEESTGIKTIANTKSITKFGEDIKGKITPIGVSTTLPTQVQQVKIASATIVSTKPIIETKTSTATQQQFKQVNVQQIGITQMNIQTQQTSTKTSQQLKYEVKQANQMKPLTTTTTEKTTKITQQIIIPKKPRETKTTLFSTKVKKQGKFITIGTFGTMTEAFNRGKQYVEQTASATFKIESNSQPLKPQKLPLGFTPSKSVRGGIVQENRGRITSWGEKMEISAKGRAVQKARKQFKKKSKRLF